MAEQVAVSSASAPAEATSRSDWQYLLLLMLLVLPLRAWLLFNTEVAARDSIGYIRYALEFESKPWSNVLIGNDQHPGYPFSVWLMSIPVRAVAGQDPVTMRVSAQLVSLLAALLLLFPMYFLGKALFDRQVGFWGALIFQYLPVGGHHLSDGISEALFLLLVALALWQGVWGVRRGAWWNWALCGGCGGLAYLARPEGALVVGAAGLVLIGMQLFAHARLGWGRFFACGVSLSAAAIASGCVIYLTTGHLVTKPSGKGLLPEWLHAQTQNDAPAEMALLAHRQPLAASVFGVFLQRSDQFSLKLGRAVRGIGTELSQGYHYVGWLPALLGLYWHFGRLRRDPAFWVPAGYCILQTIVLLLLAMSQFYVSDRHVMSIILCGSFFVAAGLRDLAVRVLAFLAPHLAKRWPGFSPPLAKGGLGGGECHAESPPPAPPSQGGEVAVGWERGSVQSHARITPLAPPSQGGEKGGSLALRGSVWSLIFLVGMIGFCLPKTVQRLHGNRLANRAAGLWLAAKVGEWDVVDDDHSWSHYYAGLVFKEHAKPHTPPMAQPTCYTVMTRSKDSEVARGRIAKEEELRQHSRMVYHWPENRGIDEARVVIYAQPREQKTHPWQ